MIHASTESGEETPKAARRRAPPFVPAAVLAGSIGVLVELVAVGPLRQGLAIILFATCAAMSALAGRSLAAGTKAREQEIDRRANERHLASLGAMIAVISHEIRNPLAALKGNAQLLAETTREDPKFRTRIERVVKEAIALEQLTNDLLTFVRSGRLRRDPTDVRVLVEQAMGVVGGDITLTGPEGALVAPIDRVRFMQAVDNLLRNAKLHGKPPVAVTLTMEDDALVVVVRDHGKGIARDRLERIFEPFETDATRGTGLGLAVVRRVAELHGGSATASNAEGGGARFTLTFPTRAVS